LVKGDYEPAGSARLELVAGVALLHEEDAVVEAMLQGWARQQLGGRGLSAQTVARRSAVVRRFLAYRPTRSFQRKNNDYARVTRPGSLRF